MLRLKPTEEIVEKAKKKLQTVTVKKSKEKHATLPAEERDNDPDNDQGEEGEKIHSVINQFSSTKYMVKNLYLSNKRHFSNRTVFGFETVILLLRPC